MKLIEGFPKTIELLPEITQLKINYRASITIEKTIEKVKSKYILTVSEISDSHEHQEVHCCLYKNKVYDKNLIGEVSTNEDELRASIPDHHITLMLDKDKKTLTFLMPNNYELYLGNYIIESYT